VPGRRGAVLTRWKLERDKQQLSDEIIDLAKVIRRLSEEHVEELIFLRDPNQKSPEAIQRRMSQISGALKRESSTLTSLFDLADLHPALQRIFLQKLPGGMDAAADEPNVIDLLTAPLALPEKPEKPTLRYLLSDREFEILAMLLADKKTKEIAAKLQITRSAVTTTLYNIRRKAKELTEGGGKPWTNS
jgi:DNA-binding CsgD family transcriptional regulator